MDKDIGMRNLRTASLALAVLAFAFLSAVNVVIFRGMHERNILENRNAFERVMNSLFASLRDHDDFGSAIESSQRLRSQVAGIAAYAQDGARIYSWGKTPETWISTVPVAEPLPGERDSTARDYIENPKNDTFIFLIHPFRLAPPPPREAREKRTVDQKPPSDHPFLFQTLKQAEIVYLEIMRPAYWRAERFRQFLFPATELLLGALVFFMRLLILRNGEYRRRIDEQRNLVVLGTAASTLAHEIKNPLLSIRLQSSILERLCPEEARRELRLINAEVDRLSALTYRVNDYLREPRGSPVALDPAEAAREVAHRLAARDPVVMLVDPAPMIRIDPDRFRSVLENIIGNAVESGSPPEGLAVEVGASDSAVRIDILDRGPGIPEGDRERAFDPFFTTKSRGTGIGLAISRRFARAAGGDIAIEGRPGGGCLVRLTFPAAKDLPAAKDGVEA